MTVSHAIDVGTMNIRCFRRAEAYAMRTVCPIFVCFCVLRARKLWTDLDEFS